MRTSTPPLERTVGHYAMAFDRNTDLLERLPARITARLDAEGRLVSTATAEYVLACYRSRDTGLPVEPALEGILRETEEEAAAVRLEVNPAARQVALMFAAEEDAWRKRKLGNHTWALPFSPRFV